MVFVDGIVVSWLLPGEPHPIGFGMPWLLLLWGEKLVVSFHSSSSELSEVVRVVVIGHYSIIAGYIYIFK